MNQPPQEKITSRAQPTEDPTPATMAWPSNLSKVTVLLNLVRKRKRLREKSSTVNNLAESDKNNMASKLQKLIGKVN